MDQKPLSNRIHCQKQHVVVRFPGHAGKIQVLRPDLPDIQSMPAKRGGFQPIRVVINLKLLHADQPHAKMLKFDPPIEVHVRYTADDYADKEKKIIRMAYWDGKKWIRFTEDDHKFKQEWSESEGRGWAIVKLTEWGDPPIAVGT